jgi:hypothetical protein
MALAHRSRRRLAWGSDKGGDGPFPRSPEMAVMQGESPWGVRDSRPLGSGMDSSALFTAGASTAATGAWPSPTKGSAIRHRGPLSWLPGSRWFAQRPWVRDPRPWGQDSSALAPALRVSTTPADEDGRHLNRCGATPEGGIEAGKEHKEKASSDGIPLPEKRGRDRPERKHERQNERDPTRRIPARVAQPTARARRHHWLLHRTRT